MILHIFKRPEVSEEQARRVAIRNFGEAGVVGVKIHVRRRRDRRDEIETGKANAGGISGERGARGLIEKTNVVRGMAWSVCHFDFAARDREDFSTCECVEVFRGHGEEFAEHPLNGITVKSSGALGKAGRISEMLCANFVDVNAKAGIFADKGSCRSGVIKMNVSEEDGGEVGGLQAAFRQSRAKSGKTCGGAAIHQNQFATAFEETGGDGFPNAEKVQVNDGRAGKRIRE